MRSDSPVEQVRAGIDVVELISSYLQLKKAGRTYKALCPFHSEKTPSFVVFPDTGRWHCFGCGEGGDVFSFVMKIENFTFAEALRRLADRIGVVITRSRESEEKREANQRLYAANEAAAVYYHGLLMNAASVREYVAGRGISDDTVRAFLLGLAPDRSDALKRHLAAQDFTDEEMLVAGLLYQPEDAPIRDRYHGRLMFPIRESDGRIVSFGARALSAEAQPKYLNGPQTDIFDKGGTLFGLHESGQAIRKEGRAVVVEGYVDVVIAHQAGFQNVVATLGTSITDRHLRQLARLAPEICLALDPDAAGETAALRGGEVAREALADTAVPVPTWRGLVRYESGSRARLTVAVLPEGKDPDELILEDAERWRETIAAARPLIECAVEWVAAQHDLSSARGKAEAAEALAPLLLDIADPVQRAHYVELAAQRLRIDSRALGDRLRSAAPRGAGVRGRGLGVRGAPAPVPSAQPSTSNPYADQFYALALGVAAIHRGLPWLEPDLADLTDALARGLALRIAEIMGAEARADWRPGVLDLIDDPWLEAPISRVRDLLPAVDRLTDGQVSGLAESMARQLRDARLAVELREHDVALQEAEDTEVVDRIKARIAENARERLALQRQDEAAPRGPAALGRRVAAVPARFRTGGE